MSVSFPSAFRVTHFRLITRFGATERELARPPRLDLGPVAARLLREAPVALSPPADRFCQGMGATERWS